MTILPIQSVDTTDQLQVGKEICHLATLKRAGWPILLGWVVMPPHVPHWQISDRAHFEQKAKILKKEWMEVPPPNELSDLLKRHRELLLKGTIFSSLEIWDVLLEHWFNQIQSIVHRNDSLPKSINLTAELLWANKSQGQLVKAVYDPNHHDVRIETDIKLEPKLMQQIDELVLKADKKLLISHSYSFWIEKDTPYLVQLRPSTEMIFPKSSGDIGVVHDDVIKTARSAMKVILALDDQAYLSHSVDGAVVSLEDLEQLVIVAQAMGSQPVFCAMTDSSNPELEGSLGLLHHKLILEKNCRNLLVAHKKEHHNNLNLVLPMSKSSQVSAQLIRQISTMGVSRGGSLRFWQTLALPENLLRLDKYIDLGFDGVLIDLDRIYQQLSGISERERLHYPMDWAMLNEFLTPALKKLHQAKVQIIVRGKLALYAEILEFLVHSGVWGVVVPRIEADGLTEHLYWTEKKVVKKRTEPHIPL